MIVLHALVAALAMSPSDGQTLPACWSFRLPAAPPEQPVFPALRLSEGGIVSLHRGSGTATWSAHADTLVVASGSGSQSWTLSIRARSGLPTATLRRWAENPHSDPEPSIDLRALPISCDSLEWDAERSATIDSPPRLLNVEEVDAAFRRDSPAAFGVTRSALVRFRIDRAGQVLERTIEQTAGDPSLDEAALRIGEVARFGPALLDGTTVDAWAALWFHFR